jgi:hypothetical protein
MALGRGSRVSLLDTFPIPSVVRRAARHAPDQEIFPSFERPESSGRGLTYK